MNRLLQSIFVLLLAVKVLLPPVAVATIPQDYDLNGNMLVRGTQLLEYDPENHLTLVKAPGASTTFGYGGDGDRLWKQSSTTNGLQVWIGNIYEEKNGKILYHIYAGDRLVCTIDSTASLTDYYQPDQLRSTTILTDGAGTVTQHYEYSAYGQDRYQSSTTAFPVTRRFTSQSKDDETGLYFYGARYYDPELGRFIQPDTEIPDIFNPQYLNRYSYCLNNPLRYIDPTGHGAIDDALFNTDTYKSSYQLMTMNDSWGWRIIEVPVAVVGMAAATADNAFNLMSLGTKSVVTGSIKGGTKAALKSATKEVATKEVTSLIKETKGAVETGKDIAEATARGRASEKRVLNDLGQTKNTDKVLGKEGASIPDFQNSKTIGEIKDTKKVTDSRQLRIQKEVADKSGKTHEIHTGVNTAVSEKASKGSQVIRRPDLGPKIP